MIFVIILSFLLFSTSALSSSEIKDNEVYKSDGSRKIFDVINYEFIPWSKNKLIYTFHKDTFETMKKYHDEVINEDNSFNNFAKQMKNIYFDNNITSHDFRFGFSEAKALSYVIFNKFKSMKDHIEFTTKSWFTLDTGITLSYQDIDSLGFNFYYSDSPGKLSISYNNNIINGDADKLD